MNIVVPIALVFLLTACVDNDKKFIKKVEVKENIVEKVNSIVPTRTGQTIFLACSACHGIDASKHALGQSQIIKGWDSLKVSNALNGYKNGTYGGTMKGIMKGQVSVLSEDDMKVVAQYISKL